MENKGFTLVKSIVLVIVVILLGLIISYFGNKDEAPVDKGANTATTTPNTPSTATTTKKDDKGGVVVVPAILTNSEHDYQFVRPSNWIETDLFDYGLYAGALALGRNDELGKITLVERSSDEMQDKSRDRILFIRHINNLSMTKVIGDLYGNEIAVSSVRVAGREIARVVKSKSTNPARWSGGSTEAYLLRNSLGEVLSIEANYSTPEIALDSELNKVLHQVVDSFKLRID